MSVCLSMFNTKCFKLRQGAFIARFVCLSVFNTKFVTLFIYLSSTRDGVKLRLGASITRFVCLSVCLCSTRNILSCGLELLYLGFFVCLSVGLSSTQHFKPYLSISPQHKNLPRFFQHKILIDNKIQTNCRKFIFEHQIPLKLPQFFIGLSKSSHVSPSDL